ncbi:NAD(P)H-dependent oxidoreductase [Erythrobacter ani]|uniref:NAD(P)H-dependent oxidoreductase n=1 Tax=Erythrobacter ani TaxID=2827235 RepID=A0ABS6SKE5_9SPHN|nr:NAD(P)H-dependent oxidoreductase [Erythrobacter ani]MBV7265488.1 NAD(P)H-dependent oxidoreductase [Erythrobacter ani]
MARITIIDGHPSGEGDHYVHALASAYQRAAEELHEVRRLDIGKLEFAFVREPRVWTQLEPEEDILKAQEAIAWADHLVIVYPLWLGDVPALLKAFLEQVMRPGFAMEIKANAKWRPLLRGKSARIIVTMGMPAPMYRLFFRSHSVKSLKRNILHFVGIKPVRTTIIGRVDSWPGYRKKWLRRVERLGRFAR